MRYPIGVQTFETIIKENYIYVDKTDLVYNLAQNHICFLSRPRRFGKSLLVSTLDAYFSGRQDLFKGLKIEALEKTWDSYPIFRMDFAKGRFDIEGGLEQVLEEYVANWESIYGKNKIYKTLSSRFQYVLEQAAMKTGKKAVILIDEYDKPLLDVLENELEESNRSILKDFYGTFKAADASLRFVLLTGVTKFSQITVFSGFNQPNDISMDSRYDAICGITEKELHTVFTESIAEMAEDLNYTISEMKEILKKQYDGYHFSKKLIDVYNPFSIINAFDKKNIDNYWYKSGTPTYLAKLLEGHHTNIQELTSQTYESQYFIDYRADTEDPLAMLYQSGYLTIKSYDNIYGKYSLDYPNIEVTKGFVTLMTNSYFKKPENKTISWIENLDRMLRRCALNELRDALTSFLASIPYDANKDERNKNFESHFQYTLYLIFRLLSCYTILHEQKSSYGRTDIIIESNNDIFIFEFKLDGKAEEALKQIEDNGYAQPYLTQNKKIHKIGVNFSSKTRTIEEWIVKN